MLWRMRQPQAASPALPQESPPSRIVCAWHSHGLNTVLPWERAARLGRPPPWQGLNPGQRAQQHSPPTAAQCRASAPSSWCSWHCLWSYHPPRPTNMAPGTKALPPQSPQHHAVPHRDAGPPPSCLPLAKWASAQRGGAELHVPPGCSASLTTAAPALRSAARVGRSGPASSPPQVPPAPPREMPAWGLGDGWVVGGGRCPCRVPLVQAQLPGHMAAWSISLCREPRLLPSHQQCQRGELQDELPQ